MDSDAVPALEAAALQRTAQAQGAEAAFSPYVPAEPDKDTPYDLVQAGEYYLTLRAARPNSKNEYLISRAYCRFSCCG